MPAPRPAQASQPAATAAGRVFDGIADLYDRARPGYPAETAADLLRICRVDTASRILEIGCGPRRRAAHFRQKGR